MSVANQIKIIINGNISISGNIADGLAALSFNPSDDLGEITLQKPEITYNTNRTYKSGKKAPDGIEIRFGTARPTEATRQRLKDHGFKFSEKQTIWYALDNELSRELAEYLTSNEIEVDTTQYVKHNFWALVRNMGEYEHLRSFTEFRVSETPFKFLYSKSALQSGYNVSELVSSRRLYFKKYFNKVAGEEEPTDPNSYPASGSTSEDIADKLKYLADGMQKEIDEKIDSATSRQRPTARRLRMAAGMREDGYRLQAIQRVLYALSDAHRDGSINEYPLLKSIRSKSQVRTVSLYGLAQKNNWQRYYPGKF